MPQNFLRPQRDQPLLLPVDMREWLPEDDLVFVVLDVVATLDLGGFCRRYRADGHGRAAFDPKMMVALLLYGYCQRIHPGLGYRTPQEAHNEYLNR
jgi:transposase